MNDKIKNIVVTITFILILLITMVVNILKKDDEISIPEKRFLQQFPQLYTYNLFNGTVFNQLEKYTEDQFIMRDNLRVIKANVELNVFKRRDYNNLYKYNDHLIRQIYPLDEESVENFIERIKMIQNMYLSENNKSYFVMASDENRYVNIGNLKIDYEMLEKQLKEELDFATYINISDLLSSSNFYCTDSHWKQETLVPIVKRIAEKMEISISTEYTEEKITDFIGLCFEQLPIKTKKDEIIVLKNNAIENCIVYNYDKDEYIDVYDLRKANDTSEEYGIYLSGLNPMITIENPQYEGTKELIVFRDSFGSSLVPLLIEGYSKITLVDTRYISTKKLDKYIDFNGKDILFIYSLFVINNSSTMK